MKRIEEEIFARKAPVPERLAAFGFTQTGNGWEKNAPLMDGAFEARVTIQKNGRVAALVWDLALDEEYVGVHTTQEGAFVGKVRAELGDLLQTIADACFLSQSFLTPQANRLCRLIFERYGEQPDFPFATAPTFGVFRNPQNRKWYGLVMNVKRALVTKDDTPPEKSPVVEIVNLKTGIEKNAEARALPGVYPAYHMKHDAWISVLLDDTLPDEAVMQLIEQSRSFTLPKPKKKKEKAGV